MLKIGCHLSASKGYLHMGEEALSIDANTFQFFTRNPRGGKAKDLDFEDIAAFRKLAEENNFAPILAHAPYTLNPCGKDDRVRAFAFEVMADDMRRLAHTPDSYYNFHPGSHVGQGIDRGIELICELLDVILKENIGPMVLLETMSGKGSEVGSRFEELKAIIDRAEHSDRIGVCLDTCHVHDAGYDIVNDLDGVLAEFDRIVGLDRLKTIHVNDSKNPFGSHKDRHEKLGDGTLGFEAIAQVINHPALRDLPFYLETPNELDGYANEIRSLRSVYRE
ncbi:MAG: deoxyribonuclease IV [Clostridiaceae bacterium]|nr:deoxyribonuclease IV [Clostridiaceae bacterium]